MRRIFYLLFLLAWLPLLCPVGLAVAQDGAATIEKARYAEADNCLNGGAGKTAATLFKRFLDEFPRSKLAPQAAYKVGCAYLLEGKAAESKQAFEALVRNYFSSPWAKVTLQVQYDEDMLFKLADEKRKRGRETGSHEDSTDSREVFELLLARFPQTQKKTDILYKIGKIDELRTLDKDGDWGKLASIALGGLDVFRTRMDELVRLGGAGDEAWVLFLQLADKYSPLLDESERIKCLLYRAHGLGALKKSEEALALYKTILREHASSPWAAEAAFALAEDDFNKKQLAQAQTAYRALAKAYPEHGRAAQARDWADWIDQIEPAWKEVQTVLTDTLQRTFGTRGGYSFTFKGSSIDPSQRLEGRFAYLNSERFLLDLTLGSTRMLFVNNREGTWYRPPGQPHVLKLRERIRIPHITGELKLDIAKRSASYKFGWSKEPGHFVTEIAPYATADLYPFAHLRRLVRNQDGEQQVTLRFQWGQWSIVQPRTLEVDLDKRRRLREVRIISFNQDCEQTGLTLSDIRLGELVSEELFTAAVPSELRVREVDTVNALELISDVVKLLIPFAQRAMAKP